MSVNFPYTYPAFPNVETRQQENALPVPEQKLVHYDVPGKVPAMNAVPNAYTPMGDIPVPGTQVFGQGVTYDEMPQNLDIVHREISLTIDQPLLYRSNYSAPRRESADVRIFAPSVTAPSNSATFLNGKQGDVYGA